jgi:hypothetical protein
LLEFLDAQAEYAGNLLLDSLNLARTSVVTLKPAICGQFKTGHRDWPKT